MHTVWFWKKILTKSVHAAIILEYALRECWNGRQARLRCVWFRRVGSSPISRTKKRLSPMGTGVFWRKAGLERPARPARQNMPVACFQAVRESHWPQGQSLLLLNSWDLRIPRASAVCAITAYGLFSAANQIVIAYSFELLFTLSNVKVYISSAFLLYSLIIT